MWTDTSIRGFKPKQNRRYRVTENTGQRGVGRLALDVQPGGRKTFYFQYFRQVTGSSYRTYILIGPYKNTVAGVGFTLHEARERAAEFANLLKRGIDPIAHFEEEEHLKKRESEKGTFEQLLASYLAYLDAEGKRSKDRIDESLERYVRRPFPELIGRKAFEIEAEDIVRILARMIERGITTHCNQIRAILHAAFQHGLKAEHNPRHFTEDKVKFGLRYNPVAFIPKQRDFDRVGEHVISREEIHVIWHELVKQFPFAGYAFRLAVATGGQRIGEVLKLPKSDVDLEGGLLLISNKISKNRRDHILPLNTIARQTIDELLIIWGKGEYLFPAKRGRGLTLNEHTTSCTMGSWVRQFCASHKDIRKFIPRDVRRTVKTEMGRAGLDKAIRDRLQNHALNDVSTRHYDRYDYLPEKREALRIWNDYLELIIDPSKKVAPFRPEAMLAG